MTTWTCKGPLTAVALMFLTACEGGQAAGLLQRVTDIMPTGLSAPSNDVALIQAAMAEGAVLLMPPKGYCIDADSLKPRFAIMARCDVLGFRDADLDAPLGLLTVSLSPADSDTLPDVAALADAGQLTQISDVNETKTGMTFRAEGKPPVGGYAQSHWRRATVTGGYVLGLSLYGAKGSRVLQDEGRDLLIGLTRQTRAETPCSSSQYCFDNRNT